MTIPAGTSASVGIVGLTLGGGIGMLSRLFGLTCDQLIEVEMVQACGKFGAKSFVQANMKTITCFGHAAVVVVETSELLLL